MFNTEEVIKRAIEDIGYVEMTPIQLASIYNCFASEGIYFAPKLIDSVKDSYDHLLYSMDTSSTRILDSTSTNILNYLLQSPFDKSLTSYASPSLINYQTKARFSAKTGTTDSSSWVVGYNPQYTICVYVGTDNNEALKDQTTSKKIFLEIADSLCPKVDIPFFNILKNCEEFSLTNKTNSLTTLTYIKAK